MGTDIKSQQNQFKLLYPYCECHTKKEINSRDKTVLIDIVMHYFITFSWSTMVPILVENLVNLLINFLETIIMTGEPTHILHQIAVIHVSIIIWKVWSTQGTS